MKNMLKATVACLILSAAVHAQDFRMETAVFAANEKKPVVESLTVFNADKVYDFLLSDPQETIIMDLTRGRFLLLDSERKMRTELMMRDVGKFNLDMREQTSTRNAQLFYPDFKYSHEEDGDWHIWSSDRLTYRVKGTAVRFKEAAERYREFADWSAQLNALRPGNLPPFARMQLNKALAEMELIPKEVEREITITSVVPFKKAKMRALYSVYWQLNTEDHKKIHQADDQLATFQPVTPDKYFELHLLAEKQ
jgi:hypothetical protein